MAWNDNLTGAALAIAGAADRRLRVIAGPGSGKSYAMQRRLMRLLEEGVPPEQILVVTFTRTAAAALVKDIGGLESPGCDDIWAGTLHSYCYGLLMRKHVFDWTQRVARPLVTFSDHGVLRFEAGPMLEDLGRCGDFGDKRGRTQRVRANEAAWARLPGDTPGQPQDAADVQFQRSLLDWLRFHEAMLIGEVVPEALRYLRNNPACAELAEYQHVLVDEYQDLNRAEQVLLGLLAEGGSCAILGDEDQSIYAFRFAHPAGIVNFHQDAPGTNDHRLDECRRCPTRVVAMADALIRHNHPPDVRRRLNPKADNREGVVNVVQWDMLGDESAGVAAYVRHLIDRQGYKPSDVLILSPRRLIGYGVRDGLTREGLPVHSFFNEEALEDEQAREAFTLLTLLTRPDDRVALRYWLAGGSPSGNAGAYAKLRQHCERTGLSPLAVLEGLRDDSVKIAGTGKLVSRFCELTDRLREVRRLDTGGVVDALLPDGAAWAAELRQLALVGGLDGFDNAALLERVRERVSQPEIPDDGEFVRVMSLHKSKGLTSKVVVVIGCMEGLVPKSPAGATAEERREDEREQRRLFYVALTRCTEVLLLSSAAKLDRGLALSMGVAVAGTSGEFAFPIASTFLTELAPHAPASRRGSVFLRSLSAD